MLEASSIVGNRFWKQAPMDQGLGRISQGLDQGLGRISQGPGRNGEF